MSNRRGFRRAVEESNITVEHNKTKLWQPTRTHETRVGCNQRRYRVTTIVKHKKGNKLYHNIFSAIKILFKISKMSYGPSVGPSVSEVRNKNIKLLIQLYLEDKGNQRQMCKNRCARCRDTGARCRDTATLDCFNIALYCYNDTQLRSLGLQNTNAINLSISNFIQFFDKISFVVQFNIVSTLSLHANII